MLHFISVWNVYPEKYSLTKYQEIGKPINKLRMIRFVNSLQSMMARFPTEAPITFRIPNSLVLLSAVKVAKPNNPRHEIRMAITVKLKESFPITASVRYSLLKTSSRKVYSNG